MLRWVAALLPALLFGAPADAAPLERAACPAGLPDTVACFRGRDANGAHVLLARPAHWTGGLVVHVHGGPRMAPPHRTTSDEDVLRYAEFLREGWAMAATSRRRAGFAIARAVEDTENARRLAVEALGQPRVTVLHGQSWGGAVAAKAIEAANEPGPDGRRPWDAALLTSAVLAGPSRAYDMRVDLRAAFQAACGTHPAPHEVQYPVTIGQPAGQRITREELVNRYLACTGADLAPEARTAAQRQALSDLVAASRVPEHALPGHLWYATNIFADIAENLTGGRSPFGNENVRYRGTADDAAFNARVPRVAADPDAAARLAADGELTGRIAIPVLTLHGIGDATVFVENEAAYRATLERAGTADWLAQVFIDENDHSKMSAALYPAALSALAHWVETGERPTPAAFRARCDAMRGTYPGECRVLEGYVPQPWEARVNPRRPPDEMARR
jgi:alpha-beta hydrolase superfamily lysophospholipase